MPGDVPYKPESFPAVAATADIALFTIHEQKLSVLLIKRGVAPFKGRWALPGGFVRPNEDADRAAQRELAEETGIETAKHLEQLRTYSSPKRDPRMRVISIAYVALVPDLPSPSGGTDANDARFWPVDAVSNGDVKLSFDHKNMVDDALERVRSKLEYTNLATFFVDEPFTLSELRTVYETIWGVGLHAPNFRRKILSARDLIQPTRDFKQASRGGPPAELYQRGSADQLHPAMLRPESR